MEEKKQLVLLLEDQIIKEQVLVEKVKKLNLNAGTLQILINDNICENMLKLKIEERIFLLLRLLYIYELNKTNKYLYNNINDRNHKIVQKLQAIISLNYLIDNIEDIYLSFKQLYTPK